MLILTLFRVPGALHRLERALGAVQRGSRATLASSPTLVATERSASSVKAPASVRTLPSSFARLFRLQFMVRDERTVRPCVHPCSAVTGRDSVALTTRS